MSEQVDISKMSRDELNTALSKEINALDGKVEQPTAEPVAPVVAPEAGKPAVDGANKEPEGVDAAAAQAKDDKDPYASRVKGLVRKRHELEDANSQKDAVILEKDRKIAELQAKVDGTAPKEPVAPAAPQEDEKKKADEQKKAQGDELDKQELADLFKKNPKAESRRAHIEEIAKDNPKLAFEAIDRMLAPEDYVDPIELNRRTANRTSGAARSRAELAQDFDPKTAPLGDLKAALVRAVNSGEMTV